MRREIAFRAAAGTRYAVAAFAGQVLSRGVGPLWAVPAILIGTIGLAGLIHRSTLRAYERRYVPRVAEQ